MSVCRDKQNQTFYISYRDEDNDGKSKSYTIKNKDWKISLGIKRVRAIEEEEIAKNKVKRNLKKVIIGITFKDIADAVIEDYYIRYKKNTAYNASLMIAKHMGKFLNDKQSLAIVMAPERIRSWNKGLIDKKMQINRQNRIREKMKLILEYAYFRNYISQELYKADLLEIKPSTKTDLPKVQNNFWVAEDYQKFINTFKDDDKWKLVFDTCYWGALRVGELLALQWNVIDFERKTIMIDKEIASKGYIDTPKTKSSAGLVDLPDALMERLVEYKKEYDFKEEDYLFFKKPTSRTTMRRIMNEHIKMAGVRKITIHGLRHSMASYMINSGMNILTISKHLRHASTRRTYDTYCHLFPRTEKEDLDKIFKNCK